MCSNSKSIFRKNKIKNLLLNLMPELPKNTTDASLKNLEALDNKATFYTDPFRKGFCVLVDEKNSRSYLYNYKINKKERTINLGSVTNVLLHKARDKWEELSKKVLDGKDVWLFENHPQSIEGKPAQEDKKNRELSGEEIIKIWHGLDAINQMSHIARLAFKALLFTGISETSLLDLKWEQINFTKRFIDSKKTRTPLNKTSLDLFLEIKDFEHHTAYSNSKIKEALLSEQNLIFNLSKNSLNSLLDREGYTRLGVEKFSPNDLSHTHLAILKKLFPNFTQNSNFDIRLKQSDDVGEYLLSLIKVN